MLDFDQCQSVMQRVGMPFTASEAHGVAVGLLSSAVDQPDAAWQAEVYGEMAEGLAQGDLLAQECRALLDELYVATQAQIADEILGLRLLLPEDDASGYSTTQALADWAQGFLFGVGLAGGRLNRRLSAEGREALQDCYAIAQLDVANSDDTDEADQQAQSEIEEYLRMTAFMIHADMQGRAHD